MGLYIKIVTWNLDGWSAVANFDFTLQRQLERINAVQPDVLLTQEMARNASRPRNRDWVALIQQQTALRYAAFYGQPLEGGEAGNAIHSRYPMQKTGGFLVTAHLPAPIPLPGYRYNTIESPVVWAVCRIFGISLRFYSVHYPHSRLELGPPNAWSQQTTFSEAIRLSLGSSKGDSFVAGDLNASFNDPPFKPLRDIGFVLDNPEYNGLMYVLRAGRNLRKLSSARHAPIGPDGRDLSSHQLVEVRYAVEEPTERRFRVISDWASASHGRYFGGWATMMSFFEPVLGFEFIVFKPGMVDWRNIRAAEQPAGDTRTRFTAAHDWAQANGYEHGFPNFHEAGDAATHVFGTFLVKPGVGEWRDVPAAELNLPDPLFSSPMEDWLRGADDYARQHGYVGGLPTGHSADYGRGHVCGVWLYRSQAVDRVLLRPDELKGDVGPYF